MEVAACSTSRAELLSGEDETKISRSEMSWTMPTYLAQEPGLAATSVRYGMAWRGGGVRDGAGVATL